MGVYFRIMEAHSRKMEAHSRKMETHSSLFEECLQLLEVSIYANNRIFYFEITPYVID